MSLDCSSKNRSNATREQGNIVTKPPQRDQTRKENDAMDWIDNKKA